MAVCITLGIDSFLCANRCIIEENNHPTISIWHLYEYAQLKCPKRTADFPKLYAVWKICQVNARNIYIHMYNIWVRTIVLLCRFFVLYCCVGYKNRFHSMCLFLAVEALVFWSLLFKRSCQQTKIRAPNKISIAFCDTVDQCLKRALHISISLCSFTKLTWIVYIRLCLCPRYLYVVTERSYAYYFCCRRKGKRGEQRRHYYDMSIIRHTLILKVCWIETASWIASLA